MGDNKLRAHVSVRIERGVPERPRRGLLEKAIQAALGSNQVDRVVSLTVVITNDEQIRELNRTYRGVDAPTDVLSFGNQSNSTAISGADDSYLGDIVISYARASEQASLFGHSVDEEISLLAVHGVLHLLGYDHEEEGDKQRMWTLQNAALDRLGIEWRP